MSTDNFNQQRFQKFFLLILVIAISAVFVSMIRQFLLTLFLAATFSGIAHPIYRRLRKWFGGRRITASIITLLIVFVVVIGPMIGLISIVASEALQVSQTVRPWIGESLQSRNQIDAWFDSIPYLDLVRPYQDQITDKLAEFAGNTGNFLLNGLGAVTAGTATFFFQFFIMLYAMFFFLIDGDKALRKILYYMPLSHADEKLMLDKFVSVTLATVKGTLLIGGIQGALAGIAFAIVGIPSATFWGTIMAVLSIIPAVGASLVWIPAVIFLIATGDTAQGIGLGIWCALVVGTVDNFLRPSLVGKETKMSDLMVLLSTLGGLTLFGIVGFIIGPLIAALFLTVWEIYGVAFKDILPESFPMAHKPESTNSSSDILLESPETTPEPGEIIPLPVQEEVNDEDNPPLVDDTSAFTEGAQIPEEAPSMPKNDLLADAAANEVPAATTVVEDEPAPPAGSATTPARESKKMPPPDHE